MKLRDGSADRFGQALKAETDIEVKECVRVCPEKTGRLRRTIRSEGPFREGKRIWCLVLAGGDGVDYALVVHEDLEAFHRVGGPKYIERPLKESAPSMASRVARRADLHTLL